MENPFKNTGEEEKVLTPIERIREAREKAKLPENIEQYLAKGIEDAAKLETLTRYVEKYPDGAYASDTASLFETLFKNAEANLARGDLDKRLSDEWQNPFGVSGYLEKIEKEIGADAMKKLMEGKSVEQK